MLFHLLRSTCYPFTMCVVLTHAAKCSRTHPHIRNHSCTNVNFVRSHLFFICFTVTMSIKALKHSGSEQSYQLTSALMQANTPVCLHLVVTTILFNTVSRYDRRYLLCCGNVRCKFSFEFRCLLRFLEICRTSNDGFVL